MGEESSGAPAAGWYDDPLTPGGKRYWDGDEWTEAVQGPAPSPTPGRPSGGPPLGVGSAVSGSVPPFDPLPPGAAATGFGGHPGSGPGNAKINDIGDWLSRSFGVMWEHRVPLAILWLLPLPFWATALLAGQQAAARLTWDTDGGDVSGFSAPLVAGAVLLGLVASVVSLVSHLGGYHYLYGAHVGRPTSWTASLLVGVTRQPRFLGLIVLVYGVAYLAIALPVAVFFLAILGSSDVNVTLVVLSIVLLLAMVLFLIWFWVKAVVFIPVAAAVVPRGTSALTAGWNTSTGRFWPILARAGIMFALATTTSTVAQTIGQTMAPTVLFSKFEITAGNDLLINGRNIDNIDVLRLSDALPNPVGMLVYFMFIIFFTIVSQAITASATAALYADAKSPNSFGHH
ncbi:MAG: DUF2510 domain-containing protein [Acidimicrobiales bacterium]